MLTAKLNAWVDSLLATQHASEWISGIVGAFGALGGGLILLLVTSWVTSKAAARDRKERHRAATFRLVQKLAKIYSISNQINKVFADQIRKAVKLSNGPKCMVVRPINRLSASVEFDLDEQWSLIRNGGPVAFNSLAGVDGGFNILLETVDEYRNLRTSLMRGILPDSMQGIQGVVSMTPQLLRKHRADLAVLDDLIAQIVPLSRASAREAEKSIEAVIFSQRRISPKLAIRLLTLKGGERLIRAKDAPRTMLPSWMSKVAGRAVSRFSKRDRLPQ